MKIIMITLLFATIFVHASYWQGTIGKSKIYLNLNCDIASASTIILCYNLGARRFNAASVFRDETYDKDKR